MASVEVRSYTLHTGRLGSLGQEHLIMLHHIQRSANGDETTAASEISFSDRFEASGGYGVIAEDDRIQAWLPSSSYPAWVDLLRHEDPVFLHWTCEACGQHDPDATLHLSTGPEPTGEGPIDLSP